MLLLLSLFALQEPSVDDLISGLRSERVEVRDRATQALRKLGGEAAPLLKPLIDDPDPEVAWRVRTLIAPFSGPMAEELFLKAEKRILEARTVRIRFDHVVPNGDVRTTGELLIKGDKLRAWVVNAKDPNAYSARIQSDGTRVRVERGSQVTVNWRNGGPPFERDAPPGLSQDFLKTFLRAGMLSAVSGQANHLIGGRKGDLVSGLKIGSERLKFLGERSSLLTFVVPVGGARLEQEMSLQPGKGTLAVRRILQGDVEVARETYDEFVLDEDLSDDPFQLPGK